MNNIVTTPSGPRVLIANDQEWTARSLESILAAEGCEIVRAYTGKQALDRAAEQPPDLIILDTQLPDIAGPEVCRQLRSRPSIGWGIPIIITTAGPNGRSRQSEALEAGAWAFLTQPFDGPLLLARIQTYLRARSELASRPGGGTSRPRAPRSNSSSGRSATTRAASAGTASTESNNA